MSAPAGSVFLMETEHAATIVRTYPIYVCVQAMGSIGEATRRIIGQLAGCGQLRKDGYRSVTNPIRTTAATQAPAVAIGAPTRSAIAPSGS